jgi:hypothetical protein
MFKVWERTRGRAFSFPRDVGAEGVWSIAPNAADTARSPHCEPEPMKLC